jgi:hypothetical protein
MTNQNFLLLLGSALVIMACSKKGPESSSNHSTPKVQQIELTVKKSSSGVCHDDSSASFTRTRNFLNSAIHSFRVRLTIAKPLIN